MKHFSLRYLDEGSPVASYVATLKNLVMCRKLILLGPTFGHDKWRIFDEDLHAVFDGECMGIRTAYIRRVVVPMMRAQTILEGDGGTEVERLDAAAKSLDSLINADDALRAACQEWLRDRRAVALAPPTSEGESTQ